MLSVRLASKLNRTNGKTVMTWKDYIGRIRRTNGSLATRLSLAAGILLVLLAGTTEARGINKQNSEYNIFLQSYEKFWGHINEELIITSAFDALSAYYSMTLLALGSKDETRSELLDALNYTNIDNVTSIAALLNKTIPTYSQLYFGSYIDLSKEAELDSEFDRILTEYIPVVVKRKSDKLCTKCDKDIYWIDDPLTQTQQVCFTSYSDYKVDWAKQFDPKQTSQMTFTDYRRQEKVSIMSRTGLALYKEFKDEFKMQMLTIPFASQDSFLILMKPKNDPLLIDFARNIYANLDNLFKNAIFQQEPTNVKIGLPKFNFTATLDFVGDYIFDNIKKLYSRDAETAILKDYPNTFIKYYNAVMDFEINEEGINYKADTVAGNIRCNELPKRETPTLGKSSVQSPFAVPEIVSLVAGIANETLKPASEDVIEFTGNSPFLYLVVTTDLTVLSSGLYRGENV